MKAMAKNAEAGFTKVALSLVAIVVACVALAIPLGMHHKSTAPASSTKKSAVPLLGAEIDKGGDASMQSDLRTVAEEIESQNTETQDYTATTWKAVAPPVAGSSISGPGQAVGGGTVNVSPDNTIVWVGSTAASFCLEATNNKGSDGPWFYSSAAGGLSQTPCTA
jgi:hypothetical protein